MAQVDGSPAATAPAPSSVSVRRERLSLPTYWPCAADPHPMFIEKRVYQGSSGRVYPLPFTDRIEEQAMPREWDAVWLENEYLSLMLLPELGGRIHVGQDKTNGYDFLYRQESIKPALVGLAGPWISGGIEFNWPQHHRPSTFMPCDVHIQREDTDGSVTVWCSEHEPMNRMKGMHGVCLRPGSSLVELRVRLYNRSPLVQTFLWWANVAVKVHDQYQSFFPPDVRFVADHAKRAVSEYPECRGHYYGVDYRPGTRLDWYKNIPVPTSYMVTGTDKDFFGGYDHAARAGLVHVASHHISPGKKQWTWGNHEFGYAWDRNLTDEEGHPPYIELMAGVFTDNQPDFSFLAPGETKTFTQHWFPIREVGCAQHANLHGAVSLQLAQDGASADIGVSLTREVPQAQVTLERRGAAFPLMQLTTSLGPGSPLRQTVPLPRGGTAGAGRANGGAGSGGADAGGEDDLTVRVVDLVTGSCLLEYTLAGHVNKEGKDEEVVPDPAPATEPAAPADIASSDELYLTGLHLEQYRHPTRSPLDYWHEALARDPLDARCSNAVGLHHLRRGEFPEAERRFRDAVARLTAQNPNPYDGEPYYNLALALRYAGRDGDAYCAAYKATWSYAWRAAGHYLLAQVDAARGEWADAERHCAAALETNAGMLQARNLRAAALRALGRGQEADSLLASTLDRVDPLDWWAAHLQGGVAAMCCDPQAALDVALDYAGAGMYVEALDVLSPHAQATSSSSPSCSSSCISSPPGSAPLVHYYRAYFHHKLGQGQQETQCLQQAAAAPPEYVFPARLQEIGILQHAIDRAPEDARARYYLGNLMYDRRRYAEAVQLWEAASQLQGGSGLPTVWRNLGIAYFNFCKDSERARAAYARAAELAPDDSRIAYEQDQLSKRCGLDPSTRLAALEQRRMELVQGRDALAVEVCALYNQLGRHDEALALLQSRRFQPWEGGEGEALGQHVRTHLALGGRALRSGDAGAAQRNFRAALGSPHNLGEAKHLLANDSNARYWLGVALDAAGDKESAASEWRAAAEFRGDFQGMAVCEFSEMTIFSALALRRLGREEEADELLHALAEYARGLASTPATIDYFATSLPTMLLFDDDLQERQRTKALFLEAQALLGLGQAEGAQQLLEQVLRRDPAHAMAADLAEEMQGGSASGISGNAGNH